MDRLPNVLGRLPKVLQNEISEFARGDRKHWKQEFEYVVAELLCPYPSSRQLKHEQRKVVAAKALGSHVIKLTKTKRKWGIQLVTVHPERATIGVVLSYNFVNKADAMVRYHRCIQREIRFQFHLSFLIRQFVDSK